MASPQPLTPKPPEKRRKPPRPKTKPGDPITLYAFISLIEDFNKKQGHGPGFAVYIDFPGGGRCGGGPEGRAYREGPSFCPLLWVIRLQFQTVVKWALEGRIRQCIYLEPEPKCRCHGCDLSRVKKPRGPKGDKPSARSAMSYLDQVKLLNARGVEWPPPLTPKVLPEDRRQKPQEKCVLPECLWGAGPTGYCSKHQYLKP